MSVQAGADLDHLDGGVLAALGGAGQASDLFGSWPDASQHTGGREDLQFPVHESAMAGVYMEIADRNLVPRVALDLRVEAWLVSLVRHYLVGLIGAADQLGCLSLDAKGVHCHDLSFEGTVFVELFQQEWHLGGLVGFTSTFAWPRTVPVV